MILNDQVTGIEIALRTDPDSFADDTAAIESTLNDGLFAEEYSIADFECFRMDHANVSLDGYP